MRQTHLFLLLLLAAESPSSALTSVVQGNVLQVRGAGTARRQVQILGLADAVAQPVHNNRGAFSDSALSLPETQDSFCLIDTTGGPVRLHVLTANGTRTGDFTAVSASGQTTKYSIRIDMPNQGLSGTLNGRLDTLDLPAGVAVASPNQCGTGNLRKTVTFIPQADGSPGKGSNPGKRQTTRYYGKTYVDTITLIATPL